jgi:hypothetical protein
VSATKHTPGPFSVGTPDSYFRFLTNEGQLPIMAPDPDQGYKRIALVDCQTKFKRGHGGETECSERDANALLFVRAANAHDDLVAALECCERWFEKHSPTAELIDGTTAEHPMLTSIRAALAKAKGGAV